MTFDFITGITTPLVYVSYLNSQEQESFAYVTTNSDVVSWIIDGTAHNHPIIRDIHRIMVTTTTYENHTQYSIIRIPAISANKLIEEIKCRAYTLGNSGQRPAESPS